MTQEQHDDIIWWARKAKLPKYMYDTPLAREALSRFQSQGCAACEMSAISDPRCSGMKHTCRKRASSSTTGAQNV